MTHPLSLPAMEALIEEYGMIPPGGTVLCGLGLPAPRSGRPALPHSLHPAGRPL